MPAPESFKTIVLSELQRTHCIQRELLPGMWTKEQARQIGSAVFYRRIL